VSPRDALEKRSASISYPVGIRNSDRPARRLVTIPNELHRLLNFLTVLDSVCLRWLVPEELPDTSIRPSVTPVQPDVIFKTKRVY
jgi:hypothetical protein